MYQSVSGYRRVLFAGGCFFYLVVDFEEGVCIMYIFPGVLLARCKKPPIEKH